MSIRTGHNDIWENELPDPEVPILIVDNDSTDVESLQSMLSFLPQNATVVFAEHRYCGGGDEYYESDLVMWLHDGILFISPKPDAEYIRKQQIEVSKRR